jgi:hypothetical protein
VPGKLSVCISASIRRSQLSISDQLSLDRWSRQTQLNVAVLVLIGSARVRRRHFKNRSLLNSYRAGAHCDLVTHDVSALFSVASKR